MHDLVIDLHDVTKTYGRQVQALRGIEMQVWPGEIFGLLGRLIHPLRMLIARVTEKELVQIVEYLKSENRIVRSKLPRLIEVTPAEQAKLIKIRHGLGQHP
jgi:ABC-type phosphonate transport system ATPase subunit